MRAAFDALMGIDAALAEVVDSTTQPALGAIRLAWWREALERLDGAPPPAEPRLQAVADALLPLGISGAAISELEQGWAALLEEAPDAERVAGRGRVLAALAGKLLGAAVEPEAGELVALVDAMKRDHAFEEAARARLGRLRGRAMSRAARPFTLLARLAARDLRRWREVEPQGTPGRAAALLSHRWFGRIA